MSKVILHGGGEHARVVLDCLLDEGFEVLGIFDPKYKGKLFGVPQLGTYDPNFKKTALAIVAIGENTTRKQAVSKMKHKFTNAIHSSAILSPFSSIGVGCMILHGVIVQANVNMGNHVILNTGCKVDHDCEIGDFVHIAPGAILCGTVGVGEGTLVGAGAIILPGVHIGKWAVIGAGSVVTRDIPDNEVHAGNPAHFIRKHPPK